MSVEGTNRLSSARSAYLRSAQQQPVNWHEWSAETFRQAQAEDKPILLDIGAVWCHWCHVMDRESYENADTAALINEHFVAVKVDRDERPDVDARYQAAVAAISGQGGWPLTAFLTPKGLPFFGGTYFPPVDGHGRPSLRRVVATMAEAFYDRRDEVEESAASVMAAIEHNETFEASSLVVIPEGNLLFSSLLDTLTAATLAQFDPRHGGFGSQPKFPNSAAIDLLLDTGARQSPYAAQSRHTALFTLEKMSKGGIYDHLAGGFHRYSVDERWVVPHFEKMSYDNSALLRNYVHAWQSTGENECARVAREIAHWTLIEMSDREQGGFYSSQDADVSFEDDGDYFTWTRAEAAAVLTPEELAIVEPFFDLGPLGDMHHNVEKNVLHIDHPLPQAAQSAGVSVPQAAELVASARQKLYAARKLRPTPFIDCTIYTAWNAMMVTAFLEAGRALNLPEAMDQALKSLDRALAHTGVGLPHVTAYTGGPHESQSVPGLLDDYVFTAHAALDAWECTGSYRYYQSAVTLAEALLDSFYDPGQAGFFDTENAREPQLGALSTRRKPLQDAPTPGANPAAATLFLRLAELTGREDHRSVAQKTLHLFAEAAGHLGLHAATYAQALRRSIQAHTQVIVVGADSLADGLEQAALHPYRITQSVIRLRSIPAQLPPALQNLPTAAGSYALLCTGNTCQAPILTIEALTRALNQNSL